jgi:hypothetical protein
MGFDMEMWAVPIGAGCLQRSGSGKRKEVPKINKKLLFGFGCSVFLLFEAMYAFTCF